MEDYYKILELRPGASQAEIKRAYFRLVRKYRPEKDPERFQEIRRAYEYLKAEEDKEKRGLALQVPDDPMGQRMMQQVEESYRKKDFGLTIRTAEEGIRVFGSCSGYVYFLALAQRMEGQTGKSVKNLEMLTKQFPEIMEFQRELAFSLQERGYGNKALAAFEKAYDMGCRSAGFLLNYGLCCEDRGNMEKGIRVLKELILEEKKKTPRKIEELLEAYSGILSMSSRVSGQLFCEAAGELSDFLTESGALLTPFEQDLYELILAAEAAGFPGVTPGGRHVFRVSLEESCRISRQILSTARKVLPDSGELWDTAEKILNILAIRYDPDLSEAIRMISDVFYDPAGEYLETDQFYRFIKTDCMLCVLEEWPRIRKKLQLLKERYPEVYASAEEFILQLEKTDMDRFRETLLKDYDRMTRYYSGYFYKKYPERMPGREKQAWDSDMEGTFRREGKKIGRNDPCPCGSGKKYKNCCGRNR